jgi:hypothetical protein
MSDTAAGNPATGATEAVDGGAIVRGLAPPSMSDTAAGTPVTSVTDDTGGGAGQDIVPSIPVVASLLRSLAMRTATTGELQRLAAGQVTRRALQEALLRPAGQAFNGAVTWLRNQLLDENAPADAVNALSRFDAAYGAAGRALNAAADVGDGVLSVAARLVPPVAYATAAYELYSLAAGSADTQGPALQLGSEWNPAGAPEAPSLLPPNTPVQVIAVASENDLINAINTVNASPGNYVIQITSNIGLTSDLPVIEQPIGSVQIDGEVTILTGSGVFRGFVVNGTNATVRNLTIQDAVANGAAGGQGAPAGEGGDGAGLLAVNNAHVTLVNVAFTGDTAQLGGGVYADASSSITVNGGSFSVDTATGGQGTSGAGNGQGDGSDIFLAGDQVLQVTANPGQTTTLDGVADQAGQGGIATVVAEGGGTVVLTGTGTFSGGVVVTADTTLVLQDAQAAGPGSITFDSQGTGILRIDPAAVSFDDAVQPTLGGMMAGDSVDLVGLFGATQVSVETLSTPNSGGNGPPVTSVAVSNGTQTEVLHFTGLNAGAQFSLTSDGNGGTLLTMTQTMPAPTGLAATSTDGTLTFSGSAQAGSTVTLYQLQLGTNTLLQLGTVTVGSNGQFSLTPGTQPDAGAGLVTAVATDSQGNASALSDGVVLPAGTGGSPPVSSPGMVAPIPGSIVIRVGTEQQLIAAIDQVNADTAQTSLVIQFTNNITLQGSNDLPALEDKAGVQILGNGYTLQGDGQTRGFLMFGANVTIDDLTIAGMVARGGAGGGGAAGGGGGAGLGGAILAVGDSNVTLDDVYFKNDSAVGGAGGPSASTAGGGDGGGGGLGGAGGSAMAGTSADISGGGGGVGNQAYGGSGGPAGQTAGGTGIIAGAPSAPGGSVDGGGGAGGTPTKGGNEGSGGGVYGLPGADGSTSGWGGGGGGNDNQGGDGTWGGGGGGDSRDGGHGGFGGGGGGGTPALSKEGTPGGFGGGRGGSGTNNSADSGGGGGGGMGGVLFVAPGSSVTIENSSTSGSSVAGGQGESGGQDGQAYGSDMFIDGNQSVVVEATAGRTSTFTGVIADETGSHDQSGATGAGSLIIEGKGTVVLDASNTYTGGTVIDGGNLELGAAGAAGSGNIDFVASGTLKIDQAAMQENNVITGFSHGDSIDLAGVAWSEGTSATVVGTSKTPDGTPVMAVSVSNSSGQQEQLLFHFKGSDPKPAFVATSDGKGGTKLTLAPSSSAAGASNDAAGHVSNLGSIGAKTELSAALERTTPAPGLVPDADNRAGSAAAGPDPTPEPAHVAVPGTDESHTIASAVQGSQGDTSSHHTR